MGKKIPVSESASPLVVNPFAGLEISGLPEGPVMELAATARGISAPGRVILRREKSGRGGKTVVVAADFAPHHTEADLEALARRARQACGCGGTLARREIELQGDDPGRARRFFEAEGFRVVGV